MNGEPISCPHYPGEILDWAEVLKHRCEATFCPDCRLWIRRSEDYPEPRIVYERY